jgi:hypothetical protein
MATSYDAIRTIFDAAARRYMIDPNNGALFIGGIDGLGQHMTVQLTVDPAGRWLTLSGLSILSCPETHRFAGTVHKLMLTLNYQYRCVKWGWDPKDGEVAAMSDFLLGDGQLTTEMLFGWIGVFMGIVADTRPRLVATLLSGIDPGNPQEMV